MLFEPFCPVDSGLFIALYCSTCCLFYLCLQIKYKVLVSFSIPFCIILWLAPSPHRWNDFDDLYVIVYDVFPRKEVTFGYRFDIALHFGFTSSEKKHFGA